MVDDMKELTKESLEDVLDALKYVLLDIKDLLQAIGNLVYNLLSLAVLSYKESRANREEA